MQTTTPSLTDRAQESLKSTAAAAARGMDGTREGLQARLRHLGMELDDLQDRAVFGTRRALRRTDHVIRSHPYQALGIAAAVGLLAGWLATRR